MGCRPSGKKQTRGSDEQHGAAGTGAEGAGQLSIEVPSWGFANTGTRFGKYLQPAAASTIEEKFADAARCMP